MILYRLAKKRHENDLSGKGAEKNGGRWNRVGLQALYLAENISLAILETIVHCQNINDLYGRLVIKITVPEESIKSLNLSDFPKNWNSLPWNNYTIIKGTAWLESGEDLLLSIPSAIVPSEKIYIVNPKHPDFTKIKIVEKELFHPDYRLALAKES